MRPSRTRSGLTLIEVIVVIFVVAILVALLVPYPLSHEGAAARKSQAMNDLTNLTVAAKAYYTDYGVYPIDPALSRKTDAVY